jgi:AcrR family transcriptional regulator
MVDRLRERLLDAALVTTSERGWSAVTMAGLGQAAGVSRQSVYNEFGSKEQVAAAMVAREVGRFLNAVDDALATGHTPTDAVERAAGTVFAMAEENPLLRSMLGAAAGVDSPVLPLLTTQSQPVIDAAVHRICQHLIDRFQDLPGDTDLRLAVDAIVRVVLSHVVQPGPSDAADIAFIAERLLVV